MSIDALRAALRVALVAAAGSLTITSVSAHDLGGQTHRHVGPQSQGGVPKLGVGLVGKRYVPSIWVDPDGCEHWVMDDGAEGFMTPHVRHDGRPVCRDEFLCGTIETDLFFVGGTIDLTASGAEKIRQFFAMDDSRGYVLVSHTDDIGREADLVALSEARGQQVAAVAAAAGARIEGIRAMGSSQPVARNTKPRNRAMNRRIDVICQR